MFFAGVPGGVRRGGGGTVCPPWRFSLLKSLCSRRLSAYLQFAWRYNFCKPAAMELFCSALFS
jgi:hypothetical protein